ncbi:hypothetical protein [Streptomyces sp. SID8352]|uniref:hypothetical protein n=1 Tax=Streptomyces sp. SID8352 TaxID=2690338 RepID=UPI001371EBF4|nr:hypothetical protein [Streptomyces sp. SID8352]MYU25175.1 hypothetical protein [Streptomyces sp. SID8352]
MRGQKLVGAVTGSAAALVLAGAIPAHAEGSWTSSMSAVRTGFDSRTWSDKNSDNVSTTIGLSGCNNGGLGAAVSNTELQLTRETSIIQPNENRGRYTYKCSSSDSHAFGVQPSGSYHFTVTKIQGSASGYYLSVNSVSVKY